jgi:predicted AlkP superfamily phosphohydrolase/phosphomutase
MIGLDAAELSFIHQYAEKLPVLSRLLAVAPAKQLESTAAQLAGSVWPTFYTGKMPGEHGIYHHLQWDQSAMRLRRVTDQWLWAEPFWYEFERRGKRVVSIDVPMTFPSRLSQGTEVINWGSHDTLSATSASPDGLRQEIRKRFGAHPMGCEIPVNKTDAELELIRANLVAGARRKGEVSRWLAERAPWDFFLTVFGETHRGGHILWPDRGADASSATALLDVYRAVDDAVGHLLDSPTMKDATIVLFALHGMGENISQEHFVPKVVDRLNAAYAGHTPADNGESSTAAKPHGQRSVMRLLREKLPAGLQNTIARAVPVGVRDFVVNRSVTGGHDWASTPGLALLADLHGYFRFNLRGRESAGAMAPGSHEFDRYRELVRSAFEALRVSETGKPLVKEIIFTSEAFPGPRTQHLPDVIMSWHVAEQASEIHSSQLGKIQAMPATGRSGNHRPHGFVSVVNDQSEFQQDVTHIAHLAGLAKHVCNGQ